MRRIDVVPRGDRGWVVLYEGDSVPISEHETKEAAVADARSHARVFGMEQIAVLRRDGHIDALIDVEPEHEAPTPRDVKGPAVS